MRFQVGQVDLDDARVHTALVRPEEVGELLGSHGSLGAASGGEVCTRASVVREDGGHGADLAAHVADGRPAGAGEVRHTGAEVLKDCSGCAPPRREQGCQPKEDVLRRSPPVQFAQESHPDDGGGRGQLPGLPSQDVHSVGSAHTEGQRTQAPYGGCVRIGAHNQHPWGRVVLQQHLARRPAPRLPHPQPQLRPGRPQELHELAVMLHSSLVGTRLPRRGGAGRRLGLLAALLRQRACRSRGEPAGPEAVAMDGRRHRRPGHTRREQLQQRQGGSRVRQ